MDAIDMQIVALMRDNSRRSFQDIGGRVSLSAPAVKRRVGRLAAAVVGTGSVSSTAQGPAAQPAGLPDLVMRPIVDVKAYPLVRDSGAKVRRRWAIRFSSIIVNNGPGHFILHGHRAATGQPCTA